MSRERIAALRAQIRALESPAAAGGRPCLAFGLDAIDRRLAGGGLAAGALHEVAGASAAPGDDAAATLFAASLAARSEGPVLWALARRDLFAPGLAAVGLAPDRLLYAECGRDEEALAVMEEGLRHGGLGAVVAEAGRAGIASARRLQLAAEEGGTIALLVRRWRKAGDDPLGQPSPAVTRWRVGCAPSAPLPAPGVGRARWRLELARQRGGEPFELLVEAPDGETRFALAPGAEHRAAPARAAA